MLALGWRMPMVMTVVMLVVITMIMIMVMGPPHHDIEAECQSDHKQT